MDAVARQGWWLHWQQTGQLKTRLAQAQTYMNAWITDHGKTGYKRRIRWSMQKQMWMPSLCTIAGRTGWNVAMARRQQTCPMYRQISVQSILWMWKWVSSLPRGINKEQKAASTFLIIKTWRVVANIRAMQKMWKKDGSVVIDVSAIRYEFQFNN